MAGSISAFQREQFDGVFATLMTSRLTSQFFLNQQVESFKGHHEILSV
jgi:hypothetical protein